MTRDAKELRASEVGVRELQRAGKRLAVSGVWVGGQLRVDNCGWMGRAMAVGSELLWCVSAWKGEQLGLSWGHHLLSARGRCA